MIESFITQFDPFHYILLLAMCLDVLLAHKLEEFSHLCLWRIVTLFVIFAAWAILIVFARVWAEQMFNDWLELIGEGALRSYEFESRGAILSYYLFDLICNALLIFFVLRLLDSFLELKSSLVLSCIVLFDKQKLFLCCSELVFENPINHL